MTEIILIESAVLKLGPVETMLWFDDWVRKASYRAPTWADIIGGAECIMVDVDRFLNNHPEWGISASTCGCSMIKLEEQPIKLIDGNPHVVYRSVMPPPIVPPGEMYIAPLKKFLAFGHLIGSNMNDVRFVKKIRR